MGLQQQNQQDNQAEAMELLMKISLSNSQQVRDSNSVVMTVHLLKSCPSLVKAQEAGQTYSEQVKKAGKDHSLGPPHPHKLVAFLETSIPNLPEGEEKVQSQAWLSAMVQEKEPSLTLGFCPFFKIKTTFSKEQVEPRTYKIQSAFSKETTTVMGNTPVCPFRLWQYIMVHLGAESKMGNAPATNLERQVQDRLTGLQQQ